MGLIAMAIAQPSALAIELGDVAPPLKIEEWVQGRPVDIAKDAAKKVHMVEFWATWCPPCKMTIPRLNDFHNKYNDDLVIVGVTTPDLRGNTPKAVRRFVKKQGSGMTYHVAIDKNDATTNAYMATSPDAMGIPYAFLIGRDGRLAWKGSPLDPALDDVLAKVIAGTYDIKEAKLQAEVDRRINNVFMAINMQQPAMAWRELVAILDMDPSSEAAFDLLRVIAEQMSDPETFRAWAEKYVVSHRDDVAAMVRLADALCSFDDVSYRAPGLALEAATAAVEKTGRKDASALSAYAQALYQLGQLDKAIVVQKDAVARADDAEREFVERLLRYYQRCKELGSKVKE